MTNGKKKKETEFFNNYQEGMSNRKSNEEVFGAFIENEYMFFPTNRP